MSGPCRQISHGWKNNSTFCHFCISTESDPTESGKVRNFTEATTWINVKKKIQNIYSLKSSQKVKSIYFMDRLVTHMVQKGSFYIFSHSIHPSFPSFLQYLKCFHSWTRCHKFIVRFSFDAFKFKSRLKTRLIKVAFS